jgi:hypothetical protein
MSPQSLGDLERVGLAGRGSLIERKAMLPLKVPR